MLHYRWGTRAFFVRKSKTYLEMTGHWFSVPTFQSNDFNFVFLNDRLYFINVSRSRFKDESSGWSLRHFWGMKWNLGRIFCCVNLILLRSVSHFMCWSQRFPLYIITYRRRFQLLQISRYFNFMVISVAICNQYNRPSVKFRCSTVILYTSERLRWYKSKYIFVMCVARSTVLARNRRAKPVAEVVDPLFMHCDIPLGTYVSACGHVMHADCWSRFCSSLLI